MILLRVVLGLVLLIGLGDVLEPLVTGVIRESGRIAARMDRANGEFKVYIGTWRENHRLEELMLERHGLRVVWLYVGCTPDIRNLYFDGYDDVATEEIVARYGENFLFDMLYEVSTPQPSSGGRR